MKSLVVLNECLLSDTQKADLKDAFQDCVFYTDTSNEEQAIKRIGNRNIVMMDQFMFTFSEKLLKACKQLELIILNTTAYDHIDTKLLDAHGVKLANLGEYATIDVAEVALSMSLALNIQSDLARGIVTANTDLPGYDYKKPVDDIWPGHPVAPFITRHRFEGQTVGIVGLGKIGAHCAALYQALGLSVIGFNRSDKRIPGVAPVSLGTLFKKADVIVIALAYEPGVNDHVISADLLAQAKQSALLVSIAHPNLLDIEYLIANPDKLRGIGFDYLVTPAVRRLMTVRKYNFIVTPHLGSQSVEAIHNMTNTMIEAAFAFAAGKPKHLVG